MPYPSLGREIRVLVLRAVEGAKLLLKPTGAGVQWLCKTEPQAFKKELEEILLL